MNKKQFTRTGLFLLLLLFLQKVKAQEKGPCFDEFQKVYDHLRLASLPGEGQSYRLKCRYIVQSSETATPTTEDVEMISNGRLHAYKSDEMEMFGDQQIAVYLDHNKKSILIISGFPENILEQQLNFSNSSSEQLFASSKLQMCKKGMSIHGKTYWKVVLEVEPKFRTRYGLKKMNYLINEATNQVEQVELFYHNRPGVTNMTVVFEETGYVEGDPIEGKILDQIYNGRQIKKEYTAYHIEDMRKN